MVIISPWLLSLIVALMVAAQRLCRARCRTRGWTWTCEELDIRAVEKDEHAS